MRERLAGQMVVDELLQLQSQAPARSSLQRVFGRSPLSDESRSWYLGAVGEIAVGRILAQLPPGWTIFHALPVGTKESDLDHVVVGPGGVFTINTKHHSGKSVWVADRTTMVNGHKHPYIRNAEHESDRVAKLLLERIPEATVVQPLIVIVDPKQINIKKRPARVVVIDALRLRRWLSTQPVTLAPAAVAEVTAVLDDPRLWRTTSERDAAEARRQFETLHAEVGTARTRRILWAAGGFALLVIGATVVLPAVLRFLLGQ